MTESRSSVLPLLMTLDEVAEDLRCTRRYVEGLVSSATPKERRLASLQVGGHRRVRRADLLAYIEGLVEVGE